MSMTCISRQTFLPLAFLVTAALLTAPRAVDAQSFELVGIRAQGMGGAFVAVADDASATWWNPAGLASGAYFNVLWSTTVPASRRRQARKHSPSDFRAWVSAITACPSVKCSPIPLQYQTGRADKINAILVSSARPSDSRSATISS